MNRLLKWYLKRQIFKERRRQIQVYGYTLNHDIDHLMLDSMYLLNEAQQHYEWGHYIQALALLEAQRAGVLKINSLGKTRLSEDK